MAVLRYEYYCDSLYLILEVLQLCGNFIIQVRVGLWRVCLAPSPVDCSLKGTIICTANIYIIQLFLNLICTYNSIMLAY